jgi:hypothetical protein
MLIRCDDVDCVRWKQPSTADLLPNYLSQRLIDPVLPARSGFLKVIKNVPVNSQGDKLLGIRDRRTHRREFCGLRSAALNAASAVSREVVVLRVLSTGILCPRVGLHLVKRQTGRPKRGSPALTINRVVCPSRTRAFGLLGGPRTDSFLDHCALEFCKYAHHLKHRLPGWLAACSASSPRKSKHGHTWPPPRARVETVQNRPEDFP